jgi:hypothetical protein
VSQFYSIHFLFFNQYSETYLFHSFVWVDQFISDPIQFHFLIQFFPPYYSGFSHFGVLSFGPTVPSEISFIHSSFPGMCNDDILFSNFLHAKKSIFKRKISIFGLSTEIYA